MALLLDFAMADYICLCEGVCICVYEEGTTNAFVSSMYGPACVCMCGWVCVPVSLWVGGGEWRKGMSLSVRFDGGGSVWVGRRAGKGVIKVEMV